MRDARKSDLILLVLNQFIWGAGWSPIKLAQEQMGPVTLNLWTLGISVLTLYPFAALEDRKNKRAPGLVEPEATARTYLDYFILGIIGLTGMTLMYAWGTSRSLAASASLIGMTVPILTAIVAILVLGERITAARIWSLGIAILGVLIISDIRWNSLGAGESHWFGNALLLGGAVCNAIYVVYSKRLLMSASPIVLLFRGQLLGFLGCLPFLYFESFSISAIATYTWQTWASLFFLGAIYFALTMVIFFRILVRLEASQIMISNYLQPFFGVLTASLLLREKITIEMLLGGLLVLLATWLSLREEGSREGATREPEGSIGAG